MYCLLLLHLPSHLPFHYHLSSFFPLLGSSSIQSSIFTFPSNKINFLSHLLHSGDSPLEDRVRTPLPCTCSIEYSTKIGEYVRHRIPRECKGQETIGSLFLSVTVCLSLSLSLYLSLSRTYTHTISLIHTCTLPLIHLL